MRVLLDECVPRAFKQRLTGHDCQTAPEAGLAGRKNGDLLRAVAGRFDALVTVDRSLRFQQDLRHLRFGIVVLLPRSTRVEDVLPLGAATLVALARVGPGMVIEVRS